MPAQNASTKPNKTCQKTTVQSLDGIALRHLGAKQKAEAFEPRPVWQQCGTAASARQLESDHPCNDHEQAKQARNRRRIMEEKNSDQNRSGGAESRPDGISRADGN